MATTVQECLPAPVLVTGGSGFLGINLIRWLLAHGAEDVRSLDLGL